jgi:hypothetical protein
VRNGGAYGDGAAKSDISFRFRTARTTGELSQFAFSSGWARASGQNYPAERFWEDERGDCKATGDEQGHGKSVAVPIAREANFLHFVCPAVAL